MSYPLLVLVAVTTDGQLARRTSRRIDTMPDQYFGEVAVLPPAPGGNEVLVGALLGGTGVRDRIDGIRVTVPDLATASLEWSRRVAAPTGPVSTIVELASDGENLYAVGIADDTRKTPLPISGNYWDSGLAASFTRAGDPRWLTVVALSQEDESFADVVATPTALYAIGSSYRYTYEHAGQSTKCFGYGLVSRIDPGTGTVVANFSIGQDRYSSGFCGATLASGALVCIGWTEWDVSPGPYRGWFCRVDASGVPPGAPVARTSALPSGGDRSGFPGAQRTLRADGR